MAKIIQVIVAGCLIGIVAAWMTGGSDAPSGVEMEQTGYYKSPERSRVMAYLAEGPVAEAEAMRLFETVPYTYGQLTRVVIYEAEPAPYDRLTLARDLRAALVLTANPPFDHWTWMLSINGAGRRSVSKN